mgnify:CR=1 FL=1
MNPPFFGARVVDDVTLDELSSKIDLESLFSGRWQLRRGVDPGAWEGFKLATALPMFERILSICRAREAIEPRILYGYFRCARDGNALMVEGEGKTFRFDFPRERAAPNRCVADFFPYGIAAFALSTIGAGASREGAELFKKNAYSDAFLLKGLAAEAAEALTKIAFERVASELCAPPGQGERFSPGFPSFPSIFDQRKIASLLKFARIGVSLTKSCQLVPEHTTTALISIFPGASHFRP